jgi:hypothetical protein
MARFATLIVDTGRLLVPMLALLLFAIALVAEPGGGSNGSPNPFRWE